MTPPMIPPNRRVGTQQKSAKLDDDKVRLMRKLYKAGNSVSHLAKMFGVSASAASAAIAHITWQHVRDDD